MVRPTVSGDDASRRNVAAAGAVDEEGLLLLYVRHVA